MNFNFSDEFASEVSKLSLSQFTKLPKRGKPQKNKEWTSLASIVASFHNQRNGKPRLKILSLSTGTKCLGQSSLSKNGGIVGDSHAEVLARRAFKRYIFYEMTNMLNGGKSDILDRTANNYFQVKPPVKFHFFTTHTPCGDASIFEKNEELLLKRSIEDDLLNEPSCKRSKKEDVAEVMKKCQQNPSSSRNMTADSTTNNDKLDSIVSDIFRTGAKCVVNGEQDPRAPGADYHVVGALRTKPGRGDPTLSMSCSDKIALWNVCGIQGALASHLLTNPMYLSSIIIGRCPFNKRAIQQALTNRIGMVKNLPKGYSKSCLHIFQSKTPFEYEKPSIQQESNKIVPCSAAIIWSNIPSENPDVCVNGRKQGITKKDLNKPSSSVTVCKKNIFQTFLSLLEKIPEHEMPSTLRTLKSDQSTYLGYKKAAHDYQQAKQSVFNVFRGWTKKPKDLQMFTIDLKTIC